MNRWVQIVIVACLVLITGLLGVIAYGSLLDDDDLETQLEVRDLRAEVNVTAELQRFYSGRSGEYAGSIYELEDVISGYQTSAWSGISREVRFHTSSTRKSVLVVAARDGEGRVECARLLRSEDELDDGLYPSPGVWRLEPNGDIRCRRRGLPWSLLHWAGLGYL